MVSDEAYYKLRDNYERQLYALKEHYRNIIIYQGDKALQILNIVDTPGGLVIEVR